MTSRLWRKSRVDWNDENKDILPRVGETGDAILPQEKPWLLEMHVNECLFTYIVLFLSLDSSKTNENLTFSPPLFFYKKMTQWKNLFEENITFYGSDMILPPFFFPPSFLLNSQLSNDTLCSLLNAKSIFFTSLCLFSREWLNEGEIECNEWPPGRIIRWVCSFGGDEWRKERIEYSSLMLQNELQLFFSLSPLFQDIFFLDHQLFIISPWFLQLGFH